MKPKLPEVLYRGDSDRQGIRMLKSTIRNGLLCTNLINGGIGAAVRRPLIDLVKSHINPGWAKTHFLSFSESEERAMGFGSHGITNNRNPIYNDDSTWSFALLKFYPLKVDYTFIEKGVYRGFYNQSLIAFPNGCWIFLINTVEYLKANSQLNTDSQLKNAKRDKEWLILPATPILLNLNIIEYSAKVDMSDVIEYELY